MYERAEAVGMILSVASQPGHGTEIAIRWPDLPEQKAL
jgi:signal transduction histidine kinase